MDNQSPELDDSDYALLLKKKAELARKKLELVKDFGLCFYKPFAKQASFHAAADKRLRMMRSGNRFGKSTMGCAEDCAWLLGYRPWIPEGDPLRTLGIPQRPVKLLVITTDWDKVDEIFTSQKGEGGKLWRMLPKGFVKSTKRNHSGAIETIECVNGSVLRFDTTEAFKKNPQGSESSDWDAIHVDEPCSIEQWKASSRGLMDRNGKAWFTLTPLREFWINDLFFPNKFSTDTKRESIWAESGSTRDNPYLTKEAIDAFEAELSADERECRLNGIPLELSGLVYKAFSFDKHVLSKVPHGWAHFHRPPPNYIINIRIDPHPQTPHAVLFEAVSPQLQRFFFAEIFRHCTIKELCEEINGITQGYFVNMVKIDPIAKINDPISGECMMTEFWRHNVNAVEASKAKTFGILNMQQVLKANPQQLFISPHLSRWLYEISRYCYTDDNVPIDENDHMMENSYRMLLDEPFWFDPDAGSSGPIAEKPIPMGVPNPHEFDELD